MRFTASTAFSRLSVTMIFPLSSMDFRAVSLRGRASSWASTAARTASANSRLSVTSTAEDSGSCSAWLRRSAATHSGFDFPSARTKISLGPAIMSMAVWPKTFRLAVATKTPPGPTILSTRGTVSVP